MSEKTTNRFLTVETVVHDHGGEFPFWSLWLAGELPSPIKDWMRGQAPAHPLVQRWLAVVESPQALKARAVTLEAVNYFVEDDAQTSDGWPDRPGEELTDQVTNSLFDPQYPPFRERLRQCVFELLDEVELPHPPESEVQREATALLDILVGSKPVRSFRALASWLDKLRGRMHSPTRLDQLLVELAPELIEKKEGRPRYRLSYRVYLRDRFQLYAEKRGWMPSGPRFHDRESAFAVLTRERIGELARTALVECEVVSLRRGWQLVCADYAD